MAKIQSRLAHFFGALAGALLAAALLPMAVASADVYEVVLDPSSVEEVTGLYGQFLNTAPVLEGSVEGSGLYDYVDVDTGRTVGTFTARESVTHVGDHHDEFLVLRDMSGLPGIGDGHVPEPGSIIDISANRGTETIYSALTSRDGDAVSDYRVFAGGRVEPLNTSYDAAQHLWDNSLGSKPIDLADHYSIVPVLPDAEQVTAINGLPPLDVDVPGNQEFNFVDPDGNVVGSFDAVQANTSDFIGNYTEALLVTQDTMGTPGVEPGDVPAVGSIFNVFYYGSDDHYYIYSDLASPDGDAISQYRIHPNGDESPIHTHFDATQATSTHSITLPSEHYELVPTGSEVYSGVNGLPPADVSVQGYQQFIVENPTTHAQIGVIDADVTTAMKSGDRADEVLLVMNDVSGTSGTGPHDIPPVGSVIEDYTDGGRETIYSDLTSPTGNQIAEYVINGFGREHAVHTNVDFAAGLNHDQFLDPVIAAASADPSAALPTDGLLDPFPHVEAALHLLASLF
jgi:hypothetical protein